MPGAGQKQAQSCQGIRKSGKSVSSLSFQTFFSSLSLRSDTREKNGMEVYRRVRPLSLSGAQRRDISRQFSRQVLGEGREGLPPSRKSPIPSPLPFPLYFGCESGGARQREDGGGGGGGTRLRLLIAKWGRNGCGGGGGGGAGKGRFSKLA